MENKGRSIHGKTTSSQTKSARLAGHCGAEGLRHGDGHRPGACGGEEADAGQPQHLASVPTDGGGCGGVPGRGGGRVCGRPIEGTMAHQE